MTEDDFRRGDAVQIAYNCAVEVSGRDHELAPMDALSKYSIKTGEQISLVKKEIRTNPAIGLPSYRRLIDPNALKDLTSDWSINDLSKVIFNDSFPIEELRVAEQELDFKSQSESSMRNFSAADNLPVKKNSAMSLISLAAGFAAGFLTKSLSAKRSQENRKIEQDNI